MKKILSRLGKLMKSSKPQATNFTYRPVGIGIEDDFVDVNMSMTGWVDTGEAYAFTVQSKYKESTVGLKVSVKKGIGAGVDEMGRLTPASGMMSNAITFSSIGEQSDNFLKLLSHLYQIENTLPFTLRDISVTAFSMNPHEVTFANEIYKFKLFFNGDNEDAYAELYLYLDLVNSRIALAEKDMDYRQNIIHFFTGEF